MDGRVPYSGAGLVTVRSHQAEERSQKEQAGKEANSEGIRERRGSEKGENPV